MCASLSTLKKVSQGGEVVGKLLRKDGSRIRQEGKSSWFFVDGCKNYDGLKLASIAIRGLLQPKTSDTLKEDKPLNRQCTKSDCMLIYFAPREDTLSVINIYVSTILLSKSPEC